MIITLYMHTLHDIYYMLFTMFLIIRLGNCFLNSTQQELRSSTIDQLAHRPKVAGSSMRRPFEKLSQNSTTSWGFPFKWNMANHAYRVLPGGWDGFGSKVEATDAFGGVLDWGYPKVDGLVH